MRKPLPLRTGDVIAVCAPAGPVDEGCLHRGIARLSAAGFVPEIADGVLAAEGYLAGGDAHRARQVEWALTLPEARAVMAARGGYGTTRILPLIDWKKAVRRRKLIVGFSDLTAVLSYLSTRLGFPCLHGPMAAADLALRFDPGRSTPSPASRRGRSPRGSRGECRRSGSTEERRKGCWPEGASP
ncbi:MAG: hypothetical protein B7Z74_07980 [Deltaproteobacteria bacterium 21-66-5]|nr:MAG: hypothetical protein B7Z74_07980 [Deltaproteobacteria bacterium 21-66-5]